MFWPGPPLRDILADVLGQHFVDERLVAHAAAPRFLPKLRQDLGVESNGDQLPGGFPSGGRPTRRIDRRSRAAPGGPSGVKGTD
jgi:hypothetical protein